MNHAKSYQQGVEDERERILEICREIERKYQQQHNDQPPNLGNSYGTGCLYGSYDTAREIRREILGEDE